MAEAKKPGRPWQEVAEEASRELDSKRLAELTNELTLALDELDKRPSAPENDNEQLESIPVPVPPAASYKAPREK